MRKVILLAALAMSLAVVGCGGSGGGSTSDPVAAVNSVLDALKNKQWDKIAPLLCAAKRDEISSKLDLTKAMAAAPSGVDGKAFVDAMTIDIKDRSVTQKSLSGDNAVVTLKGNLVFNVPDDKMKTYVKSIMSAGGQTPSEEQINAAVTAFKDQEQKGQPINSDVQVVKENGQWLVCSDPTQSSSAQATPAAS
jgi:hypothetical protein